MYITATGAFLPPHLPVLLLVASVPRIGHIAVKWAWPSTNGGAYLPGVCTLSLN